MLRPLGCLAAILLISTASLQGQAHIPPRGVVNAASFARPGLSNGKIARGSIFSIFGQGIGPTQSAGVSQFPLQTTLGGVEVTITQGDQVTAAIPLFVSAGQVNAILPSNAPLGLASLQVKNGVRRTNPVPLEIVASSLGIFTATGSGAGPGVVQNFESSSVQPFNSLASAASRGQIVTIWATGLGPVTFADNVAPTAGNLDVGIEVWIGNAQVAAADILYFGRTPCCAGVDQIVLRVPQNAPPGCYVPVQIRTNGQVPSNSVTMAIADESGACGGVVPVGISQGAPLRTGLLALLHSEAELTIDRREPGEFSIELGAARFRSEPPNPFAFDPISALPPTGSCTTYGAAGGLTTATFPPALAAGAVIDIKGPRGLRRLLRSIVEGNFQYASILGGLLPGGLAVGTLNGTFLSPGNYQATAPAGADVGAIDVAFAQPAAPEWSNRGDIQVIDRSQDVTIRWTGTPTGTIVVGGLNFDVPTDSVAAFGCVADPAAGAFTVPARILSTFHASRSEPYRSRGGILLWNLNAQPLGAQGLDAALAVGAAGRVKTVLFE